MERNQKIGWDINEQKCSFCCSPSGEIRLILAIVLNQLRKMLQEKKYADMPAGSQENNGAMGRLLRVIFHQHQFELKLSKNCPHMRLRNLIRQKLECRSDQLEYLMEDLCDRTARRHYQLQIIASQIKNVENSITELDESSIIPCSTKKSSSDNECSIKEESKQGEQEERPELAEIVKVEEVFEASPKITEGSPAVGTPYAMSFGQMPYSYNFLFYGSYYQ